MAGEIQSVLRRDMTTGVGVFLKISIVCSYLLGDVLFQCGKLCEVIAFTRSAYSSARRLSKQGFAVPTTDVADIKSVTYFRGL